MFSELVCHRNGTFGAFWKHWPVCFLGILTHSRNPWRPLRKKWWQIVRGDILKCPPLSKYPCQGYVYDFIQNHCQSLNFRSFCFSGVCCHCLQITAMTAMLCYVVLCYYLCYFLLFHAGRKLREKIQIYISLNKLGFLLLIWINVGRLLDPCFVSVNYD